MSGGVPRFVVVGIGADGWDGLTRPAQDELTSATTIIGSSRQLSLLAGHVTARTVPWRSPMSAHLDELIADDSAAFTHIVASGDPMFHGVGASIVARVGRDGVRVIPAVSSVSLAAARMGWDLARTEVVSLVSASPQTILASASHGKRVLVLSRDQHTPAQVAEILARNSFAGSTLTVLEQLGGSDEKMYSATAGSWASPSGDPLNVVALEMSGPSRRLAPGLPDDDFDHDGQLTKHVVRAVTVGALAPTGGQVLWDIGAGSGSVAIEWLKTDISSRALAFESHPERAERIASNAARHGVADRLSIVGSAPESFDQAPAPDTVFIGGGLTRTVLDEVWLRLGAGGRLVINAVTVENQSLLAESFAAQGGTLTRLGVEHAAPLGTMTTWRPALPIVQWVVEKRGDDL
ncbi:precorrin-6Y C5,15-methyltransferase [Gordonia effusa NBRC 100432]|uniref:Precorrin-6Y C5,15-methyltransferase n=1 Tax=Gordonia effusa NBRC 100432 TaxID=1077974 RepID=H0R080_9ACTN|nr:precorrin-6Y C5,15-methyltransferase [Gordonia effusa NBRC 100432]